MAIREHIPRHAMPVERAIHWKPVRDPHYVLATLRTDRGGPLETFIHQRVLARVEQLARATQHRFVAGLLLGQHRVCSGTGASYLIIDSMVEHAEAVSDEALFASVIADALAHCSMPDRRRVFGWYSTTPVLGARPSAHVAAVHAAHFRDPWQTALVVADASGPRAGALFAYDPAASRFYQLPFYELASSASKYGEPKPTCIEWPQYITVEPVVHEVPPEPSGQASPERVSPPPVRASKHSLWNSFRSFVAGRGASTEQRRTPAPMNSTNGNPPRAPASAGGQPTRNRTVFSTSRPNRSEPRPATMPPARPKSTPLIEPHTDAPDGELPILRRVSDADDTGFGEARDRYLELARSEGFFVATKFDSQVDGDDGPETLWLLTEPFSGLLLTVVSGQSNVMDATLHYNLHIDDPALLERVFREHRDLDSQTIYMRESCVELLRARCRRLRTTNALERSWRVAPVVYFVTPAEWQSITDTYADARDGAEAVRVLNEGRIGVLSSAVRDQFRLVGRDGRKVEGAPTPSGSP
jgi:hypothetical protein